MPRRRSDPDHAVTGDDVDARLFRRILIWAQIWRRCPRKGCRRSHRCLRFDDCAGVPTGHYWPSEKDKRRIWDPFRAAMRAEGRGQPAPTPRSRR